MYLCCWLSLFEVYKRVGKSAIWVLKEPKGQTNAFHGCGKKKMEGPSWFCNALIFKRRYIYSSYKECKELGNRRYTKCTYPVKNSL